VPDESERLILRLPLDAHAVGDLYDRFYDLVYRYCRRRLYFHELAEDAVAGIFLTMAQRVGSFRGRTGEAFRAWLFVLAGNHVNQLLRREERSRRLLDQVAEHVRTKPTGDPERRWAALHRSLLTLDEDQQHLISLRFFHELSHDDIAAIIGIRVGAVRVRLHRALGELRPRLQRELDDACEPEVTYGP